MMLIDPKLLEQLEGSTCFGIAHDPDAKECKGCDIQQECAAKTAGNRMFDQVKSLKPETKEAMEQSEQKKSDNEVNAKASKKEKAEKKKAEQPDGMPDFKGWSEEDLWKHLEERGGTCKKFENPGIQKMRLVMAIKKTYK